MTGTILLDLDGTLIDPQIGILDSYRHALRKMNAEPDPADNLHWVIGPPLRRSFAKLLGEGGNVEEAVRQYRDRYADTGIFQATVYPGISDAIVELRSAGFDLLLCTAKARVFADRIVEKFGFAEHLSGVYGAELDGRFDDKGDLIAHILETRGLTSADICMVGDRDNDVLAAARNGAPCIGVLWGYGGEHELRSAGAADLIEAPEHLRAACERVGQARPAQV
jgi:phosphoglycolate phosphatase